jgi:hypothetical protein
VSTLAHDLARALDPVALAAVAPAACPEARAVVAGRLLELEAGS